MITTNPNQHKGTILLVDDLPENLQLLSELLIQMGYSVRSVTSGKMALKTLHAKQPNLILLDIKMPEMDGYQVCSTLKADENLCDIPIIFTSALDDTFDKVKAFECGGVDYITKPFHIEEVVARIENQLTIQRQRFSLQQEIKKRQETEAILYQSRALLASVLNSALDGITALQAIRDPWGKIQDFRCLMVNPVIATAFGKQREDLIGKILFKYYFVQQTNSDFFDRVVAVVETGESLEEDFYYPVNDSYWYHCFIVKLDDGIAITVRDITARKNMELALQAANHELQALAHLDGLTKIANRRCADEFLDKEWRRLCRSEQPLSILLLDVDYFKLYNDCYGHQQGDDCLIQIAKILQNTANRPADLAARYGGEEFIIILSETQQDKAINLAQSINDAIQALAMPHQHSKVSTMVTVSIGVASMIPDLNHTPDYLINQADAALYSAKHQGRNRYCVNTTIV